MQIKLEMVLDFDEKEVDKLVKAAEEQGLDWDDPGKKTQLIRLAESAVIEEFGDILGVGMSHEIIMNKKVLSTLLK